ncbi:hypothetical protein M9H77_09213 [Catharanthus roseus]|uniref:Uncharacterized protein n=1 Tax=Catharanthus roseus TaxID=4058 RepID=A0ACC0BZX1_CATRO|nr:hypothetical protein M9H77_09213 [Catharanthus roseus]
MAAAASSSGVFLSMREGDDSQQTNQLGHHLQAPALPASSSQPQNPAPKRRRNQPGTPNPDAEVIALSPKTLMATNRFICEVCNKGFQREQNLQLHRRGHNLPWKLRQKTTKEVKRKVYLCPEPTCVHHDPSRALGDLTGIKKHYSRKHGEKKFKCDKCSKKYAVQSDWKAHSKTCGTREYRCDCGTLFSRRDSFITHRAFCDALAQESARNPPSLTGIGSHLFGNTTSNGNNMSLGLSQLSAQISASQDQNQNHSHSASDILRLGNNSRQFEQHHHHNHNLIGAAGVGSSSTMQGSSAFRTPSQTMPLPSSSFFLPPDHHQPDDQDYRHHHEHHHQPSLHHHGLMRLSDLHNNVPQSTAPNIFNLSFFPTSMAETTNNVGGGGGLLQLPNPFNNGHNSSGGGGSSNELGSSLFSSSGSLVGGGGDMTSAIPSLYSSSILHHHQSHGDVGHMSATALLQKAAQLGSTTSNSSASSLLKSFGSTTSNGSVFGTATDHHHHQNNVNGGNNNNHHLHELVNSITAGGGSSIFGGGGGSVVNAAAYSSGQEEDTDHHQYFEQTTLKDLGGEGLTRDFLGVGPAGELVRTVSGGGGYGQREAAAPQMRAALDSERKAAPKSQAFGGVSFQ